MSKKLNYLNKKPVNLQLWTINFPITAIVSILHRISGLLLFLFIPFILWLWQFSLASRDNFAIVKRCFSHLCGQLIIWFVLTILLYHLIAGIRHLLMDLHIGDSKEGGKIAAISVLVITAITSGLLFLYLYIVIGAY